LLLGQELYDLVSYAALALYTNAADYAAERGVILADTKFEFGLIPSVTGQETLKDRLILIDEVLTPDSSRYWPADKYAPGRGQESFDKQYLRDWLSKEGFKKGLESGPPGKEGEGWLMTPEVLVATREKYLKAKELLVS
jgi:phosphoribosylaminoimidazole-succinocarboxamide synthase